MTISSTGPIGSLQSVKTISAVFDSAESGVSAFHGGISLGSPDRLNGWQGQDALEAGTGGEMPAGGIPAWKRVLDCICILLSLPIWLPLMLLVALWTKIVSPGPLFFKQERVGYLGRTFLILKFRSMHVNAETLSHEQYFAKLLQSDAPMLKMDGAGDRRMIFGGRLLRALGVDELPQIFNVLMGDMSLVGPRPCTLREYEHYDETQKQRVMAPPGLTGHWQVSGKNRTTFSEMIALDLFYAQNMSIAFDLSIMFKTVPAIVQQTLEARAAKARRQSQELPTETTLASMSGAAPSV